MCGRNRSNLNVKFNANIYLFIIIDTVLTLIFLSDISTKNHVGFIPRYRMNMIIFITLPTFHLNMGTEYPCTSQRIVCTRIMTKWFYLFMKRNIIVIEISLSLSFSFFSFVLSLSWLVCDENQRVPWYTYTTCSRDDSYYRLNALH